MILQKSRWFNLWEKVTFLLWLGFVAALPITSFPLFAKVIRSSAVAPASGIFMIALVILWVPIFIYKGGRIPCQSKPVILFFLIAIGSVFLAFYRDVPDFKNGSIIMAGLEGVVTLGFGLLFYLISASFANSEEKIKKTLAVLNWSGLVLLIWSILQIVVSLAINDFTDGMRTIQHIFSTTVLFDRRTTGFASEPSWLAHQLNLVYLAYWIAASLKKYSAHRLRIWKFSFENLLLIGGILTLFATFSRGGLAAFVLVLAFLFILANIKFVGWVIKKWKVKHRLPVTVAVGIIMFLVYVGMLILGLFALSKIDPRMEKALEFSGNSENPLLKYAENLQFGERVVYWQTGWNIFNDHPLLGVGVNYSGFYFPKYLPDYGWKLTEVRSLFYRTNNLLNIKSIWSRILAETGIVGFSVYSVFLVISAITAITMLKSKNGLVQTIGWMGIFMLIAYLLEGFSVDSFALPYVWFTLGLVGVTWRWVGLNHVEEKNG